MRPWEYVRLEALRKNQVWLPLLKIKTEGMISKTVPLSDIQAIFNELLQVRNHIKVLIAC